MNNNLITVEVLINEVLLKFVLIDIGYKYYFIVDKNLVTKLRLLRVKIPLKPITGFVKCHGLIARGTVGGLLSHGSIY